MVNCYCCFTTSFVSRSFGYCNCRSTNVSMPLLPQITHFGPFSIKFVLVDGKTPHNRYIAHPIICSRCRRAKHCMHAITIAYHNILPSITCWIMHLSACSKFILCSRSCDNQEYYRLSPGLEGFTTILMIRGKWEPSPFGLWLTVLYSLCCRPSTVGVYNDSATNM